MLIKLLVMYKAHTLHTGDAEKVGSDEDLPFASVHRQSLAWEKREIEKAILWMYLQSLNFNSLRLQDTKNYMTSYVYTFMQLKQALLKS